MQTLTEHLQAEYNGLYNHNMNLVKTTGTATRDFLVRKATNQNTPSQSHRR